MKILQYFGINLRTVQRIQKDLDEFNGDYESTATWKSYSGFSDKKKTPGFVGEIQSMIDNDPTETIARHMVVSKILIRQVMYEDIRSFS